MSGGAQTSHEALLATIFPVGGHVGGSNGGRNGGGLRSSASQHRAFSVRVLSTCAKCNAHDRSVLLHTTDINVEGRARAHRSFTGGLTPGGPPASPPPGPRARPRRSNPAAATTPVAPAADAIPDTTTAAAKCAMPYTPHTPHRGNRDPPSTELAADSVSLCSAR